MTEQVTQQSEIHVATINFPDRKSAKHFLHLFKRGFSIMRVSAHRTVVRIDGYDNTRISYCSFEFENSVDLFSEFKGFFDLEELGNTFKLTRTHDLTLSSP